MRRVKIGFDIDGVVVDLVSLAQENIFDLYKKRFDPRNLDIRGFEAITGIPYHKIRKVIDMSTADISGQLAHIYVDDLMGIYRYYELTGKPLVFVTHRWDIENTEKLFSILFPPKTYRIHYVRSFHSKGDAVNGEDIDIFIEDSVNEARKVQEDGVKAILVERPWNKFDTTITKVKSVKEVIGLYEKGRIDRLV